MVLPTRPFYGEIRIELGAGVPLPIVPSMTDKMKLKTPQELLDLALLVLQGDIEKLVSKSKRGELTGVQARQLNEHIRTLSSISRRESTKDKLDKEKLEAEEKFKDDLGKLTREQILALIPPDALQTLLNKDT